jgi:hypothetical protein
MRIEQTDTQLVIRETPGCLWIFSLLFVVVGSIFIYGSFDNFINFGMVEFWMLPVAFLFGAIGVMTGVWMIYRAPITKITIDSERELLTFVIYGLTGRTQSIYHFDEIDEFQVIEETDAEGSPIWSLGLNVSSGETIKVSSLESNDETFKRNFAYTANVFMNKQLPESDIVFELEDDTFDEIN